MTNTKTFDKITYIIIVLMLRIRKVLIKDRIFKTDVGNARRGMLFRFRVFEPI